MNTKTFRTVLLTVTLIMPIVLWLTRTEWYKSMSAFANADNQIFYNAMHLIGSWFFILNSQAQKRDLDTWIGFAMGGVLLTNMYDFYIAHLVCTVSLVALCVWSMVFYSRKQDLPNNIVLASFTAGIFLLSLFTDVHIFLAEWCVMLAVSVHMLRRIYIHPNA